MQQNCTCILYTWILSHFSFSYCSTTWSQTSSTLMQPLQNLYKQALKVMDKKPNSHHYCNIVKKNNLLTFENFLFMSNVGLVYKIIHDLAPQPLKQYVTISRPGSRLTRASPRVVLSFVLRHLDKTAFQ